MTNGKEFSIACSDCGAFFVVSVDREMYEAFSKPERCPFCGGSSAAIQDEREAEV
jgi:Zn finger protein HypA/HybF involved in hydrogenase expression